MSIEVLLPKLGLTMEEGLVDDWLVDDGDLVAVGDPILRLATDKVDVDVEAEAAGRFHAACPAGTTLPPGALVAWLLADGESDRRRPRRTPTPSGRHRPVGPVGPVGRRLASWRAALGRGRAAASTSPSVAGTGPGGASSRTTCGPQRLRA